MSTAQRHNSDLSGGRTTDGQFVRWYAQHNRGDAAQCLERDRDRLTTFYQFPQPQWQHLRTMNAVESPLAAVRLGADVANELRKWLMAAVIWRKLMIVNQIFRRV